MTKLENSLLENLATTVFPDVLILIPNALVTRGPLAPAVAVTATPRPDSPGTSLKGQRP